MAKRSSNKISTDTSPAQLTLVNLAKLDKENDDTKEISLADGKFKIVINTKFRNTQIQKLIIDLQEAITTMRISDVNVEDVSNIFLIQQMLILKYFTNLPIGHLNMNQKLGVSQLIAVSKQLLDSNIFKEIFESFSEDETAKVYEAIKKSSEVSKQFGEMLVSASLNTEKSDENEYNESGSVSEGNSETD